MIQNNIFYENCNPGVCGASGVEFYNSTAPGRNIVTNNLFYSSRGVHTFADTNGGASYTASNNMEEKDPMFVKPSAHDFHLNPPRPPSTPASRYPKSPATSTATPALPDLRITLEHMNMGELRLQPAEAQEEDHQLQLHFLLQPSPLSPEVCPALNILLPLLSLPASPSPSTTVVIQ